MKELGNILTFIAVDRAGKTLEHKGRCHQPKKVRTARSPPRPSFKTLPVRRACNEIKPTGHVFQYCC
jgi:hypothetical protein